MGTNSLIRLEACVASLSERLHNVHTLYTMNKYTLFYFIVDCVWFFRLRFAFGF